MKKFCWLAPLLLAVLHTIAAHAATVPDLYAAAVPIADATPEAREAAYSLALARVLVRASGQRDIARRSAAAPILEAAGLYVQKYTQRGANELWVSFDGTALDRALAAAGLPVWNRDRPAILIWLATDRGGGRRLIGAADDNAVKQRVMRVAAQRGLPLVWPLLDSEDLAAASAADVWGGFGGKVRAASARYGADAILVARMRGEAGRRLYGTWDLETGSGSERFEGGLSDGVHGVADFLVSRLAAGAGASDGIAVLTVGGVRDLTAYSNTLAYLERLSLVESVALIEAQGEVIIFQIAVRGDPASLRRAIRVGNVLRVGPGDDGVSMNFRYAQ